MSARPGQAPDNAAQVEESAEQILARLIRYRDSLPRPPRPLLEGRPGLVAPPAPVRRYPARPRWRPAAGSVAATFFGQLLAVLACTLAVLSFERFDASTALGVVLAATAIGVIASARRIPLALWWTVGVVIGGALGRWS